MINSYQLFAFLLILTPKVLSQDCRTDLPLDCSKEATSRYRTFDGTCNNIGRDGDGSKPFWGKAVACFERLVPPEFGDYSGYILRKSKKNGQPLPNPRSISNALMSDKPKLSDKFSQIASLKKVSLAKVLCISGNEYPNQKTWTGLPGFLSIKCFGERVLKIKNKRLKEMIKFIL